MPTTFAVDDWAPHYNKASVTFTKDYQAAVKADPKGGAVVRTVLKECLASENFLGALSALDRIDLNPKGGDAKAAIKLFKAGLAKLESEAKKLAPSLDEAIELRVTLKTDKDPMPMPKPLKDVYPESYRHLKVLRTQVKAIVERAGSELAQAENRDKLAKIAQDNIKAKEKANAKAGTDLDAANKASKAISEEAAMKTFVIQFAPSFKSAMAKAGAAIQRIKASPDLATYNKEMNNAGRDISQNLVNIVKLQSNPAFKKSSLAKKLPPPGAMATELAKYGNGNLRSLPGTATPTDIKNAFTDFVKLYKDIATAYAEVLAGKIK